MQIEAIPMLINSDFMNVPLDKLLHLMDYKMHGEDSYVFQQKELLHGLYECTYLSMNDRELVVEAFVYLIENNKHIGKAFGDVYGIGRKDTLSTLSTMQAVAASSTAMQAVANSSTAMQAVANSSTAMQAVANSSTAMQAVANSSTAMQAVANSSTAMQAVANSSTAMQAVANSSTAMQAVANSSTAMQAVANSSTAMQAVANSSTAMQAVANSSTAMQAVANSSTAIQALSKSSLRVKLTYGKKVENGLMLIMSTGPSTYFAKDFNNVQTSYIKFTDGTVYPSQDGYKGSPTFGSFFKEHPKSAFFARTYYQFNDCYMDLILIRGTIVNAQ